MIFGPPLGSSSAQNGTQNLPKNCARSPGVTRRSPLLAFLNRPCFSLNHSNYAAVGPYWILKRRFWMKVCSFVHIFLIFRLYIISPFFTHLFHKTTVNVQPLSPPVFNKIATHSKNLRSFIFFYLGLHVFNLLLFLLIFRSPLAPSWCRMGWKWCQILILWVVFWYNFVPRCQKRTQPTTPRTFSFVTLAPKPDFHLHCDQPQHETHNLQHTLSEWICCCFGIIFWIDVCECFFFTLHKVLTRSAKISKDLPRSAKIKQDQPKDRQAQTCKRHLQKQIMKRRAPKMRGRRCHAAWRLQ